MSKSAKKPFLTASSTAIVVAAAILENPNMPPGGVIKPSFSFLFPLDAPDSAANVAVNSQYAKSMACRCLLIRVFMVSTFVLVKTSLQYFVSTKCFKRNFQNGLSSMFRTRYLSFMISFRRSVQCVLQLHNTTTFYLRSCHTDVYYMNASSFHQFIMRINQLTWVIGQLSQHEY